MKLAAKTEFGDFQTPTALAQEVCARLRKEGCTPDFVLEPTCGVGAFLLAAAREFPSANLRGWDINPAYAERAAAVLREAGADARAVVGCQDFFEHDWEAELLQLPGNLLILGNLPWVTNSAMAALNGGNLPLKENFLGLRGLAARTGKANFDISEWMLICLLRALRGRTATIAMLCKTATARKFLRFAWQNDGQIRESSLHRIDADLHFKAAVDACLLIAKTGGSGPPESDLFESLSANRALSRIGLAGQDLVADIHGYRKLQHLEGLCPFQWRSGVKHDCAAVMELKRSDSGVFENKLGEQISIELDCLYPLLKCSDLANNRLTPGRFVLVTQERVGGDTSRIAHSSPLTWNYLQTHRDRFAARKSSIYQGGMPFALFGIGDYAFAPWKVAVSGLHRSAGFRVVGPFEKKAVFFDDACYFLPFKQREEAMLVAEVLNSKPCQAFLRALIFSENKRPITVELLQRLNLGAIAREAGHAARWLNMERIDCRFSAGAPQYEFVMERGESPPSTLRSKRIASTSYRTTGRSRKNSSEPDLLH